MNYFNRKKTYEKTMEERLYLQSAEYLIFKKRKVDNFNENEFPKGTLKWMHYTVIESLEAFRKFLPIGCSMYPAISYRSHVRHNPKILRNSAHSTCLVNEHITELSTGTDIFTIPKYFYYVWETAPFFFKGVGIYLDHHTMIKGKSVNYPMFHFDLFSERRPLKWVHTDNTYIYITPDNQSDIIDLMAKAKTKWIQ